MFGLKSALALGGIATARRMGQGVVGLAGGRYGRTAAGALYGGLYGAASDDTSILGGAVMGAGIARYGGAGIKRASMSGGGMGLGGSIRAYGSTFGRGVGSRARLDYRGARMMANKGFNKIRSSLRTGQ